MGKNNRNNNNNTNVVKDEEVIVEEQLDTELVEEQIDASMEENINMVPAPEVVPVAEDTELKNEEDENTPDETDEDIIVEDTNTIGAALDQESIINEQTLDPVVEPVLEPVLEDKIIPEIDPIVPVVEEKKEEPTVFSKEVLIDILDSTVEIDDSKITIYNTADDMVAVAKLEKIYALVSKLGANSAIAKVISQALKYAATPADRRKGDTLYSTLMREINTSASGKDFDLLMFVVTRTFKALRTLGEPAIVRSFREVKNVEVKQSALLLSHLICQLSSAEDRKKKIGVTISLDKAVQVSPSGLNQNGANLIKDYFKK